MDTYRMYDPSLHSHCIVARNGRFLAVEFVDENGNPLGMDILEERLKHCIQIADNDTATMPLLGWLTSSNRDSWADAREQLLHTGGKLMEEALEKLESGALLLCLDHEEPVSKKECGDLFWTGSLSSGHNRWFDKSIQLFVTDNGKAGLQGEHSMVGLNDEYHA
jgi:carnitine O-acetyltransferase